MAEDLIIEQSEFIWHHFDDPEDPEFIVLAASYSFHKLALENCTSISSRPKLDLYDNYIFIVLNAPSLIANDDRITEQRLCVFLGSNYIVTVSDGKNNAVEYVKESHATRKAYTSAQEVFYAVTDYVCDQFFPTLDAISDEISDLELRVHEKPDQSVSQRATSLKRILNFLRRLVSGHRSLVHQILRSPLHIVNPQLVLYFRDTYDNLIQTTDVIETDRDLLTGIIDLNLSTTAHRTNEIVKTLTVYATILLPLELVTSFFGMNFDNMPLIHDRTGITTLSLALLAIAVATGIYLKRHEW